MTSTETVKKHLELYYITGYTENQETTNRYIRLARATPELSAWIRYMETTASLRNNYTDEEIETLRTGGRIAQKRDKAVSFDGETFRFAHITDTHMGSVFFHLDIWDSIVNEINKQNLDAVFHSGDVTDGMNTKRIDQIYDLTHIGYKKQKDFAIEQLSKLNSPMYMIDGNHDRWFKKSSGAIIVEDICAEIDHATYMGEDMADFLINGIKIRLWHGEDGSSYATSYRPQKLVEAFTGGDKPNILLCGHTHKQGYFFDRNVHIVSGGAVSTQSDWMKRTRKANHTGFHICEATISEKQVKSFSIKWYPFYE